MASADADLRLRLRDGRLIGSGIDGDEEVAWLDQRAFAEVHRLDGAGHARPNLDAVDRLEAAGKLLPGLDIARLDDCNRHRHGDDCRGGRRLAGDRQARQFKIERGAR